jgi:hypothetical protein
VTNIDGKGDRDIYIYIYIEREGLEDKRIVMEKKCVITREIIRPR